MGKLPGNLVKPPAFDNPLRPTATPSTDNVVQIATPEIPEDAVEDQHGPAGDPLAHRISARFTDDQWKALQRDCHSQRMHGKRMNVAELLRQIVDEWRSSK
jgi:hypothetical protein